MGVTEDWLAYRESVKKCKLCDSDVSGRPVPAYFHPQTCDILLVGLVPEEADHKAKQVTLFTSEQGAFMREAAIKAGLGKHVWDTQNGKEVLKSKVSMRLGWTTCIKCVLSSGRAKRKVFKQCTETFFPQESSIRKPHIVGLLGVDVAKLVIPSLYSGRKKANIQLSDYDTVNRFYTYYDTQYFILPDPADGLVRGKFSPKANTGQLAEFVHGLSLMREYVELGDGRPREPASNTNAQGGNRLRGRTRRK